MYGYVEASFSRAKVLHHLSAVAPVRKNCREGVNFALKNAFCYSAKD